MRAAVAALIIPATVLVPAGPASGDDIKPMLLDVVVAVDESGSLTDDDVAREIDAARSIALSSGLNPGSRVTVFGFGSENAPGTSAVDVVCPTAPVDTPAERTAFDQCVRELHRRTPDEGNDTDHAAALRQALSHFIAAPLAGASRVVFLLTDGVLDVRNSSQYGAVRSNRNDQAMGEIQDQLKEAQRLNVQIWPLGFGQADQSQLESFVAGHGCSAQSGPPRAQVISSSAALRAAVVEAFGRASCLTVDQLPPVVVNPGSSADITVKVPAVATDGTILVSKGDKRIKVTYRDPGKKDILTAGTRDGSEFSVSGQDSETESLRIKSPRPGAYTVHVEAGKDLPKQRVQVAALWQGAVRASLSTSPPVAAPGQKVVVHVSLRTRNGPLTSADALEGIAVTVSASDSSSASAPATTIAIRNDGKGDDPTANDGQFSGSFTAPGKVGGQTLRAEVTGPGIHAEPLTATLLVNEPGHQVLADISLSLPEKLVTGSTVTGKISAKNDTSSLVPARLELRDSGGLVSLQGLDTLTLAPGQSTADVGLTTRKGGPTGQLDALLVLVNAKDPSLTYGSARLRTQVSGPPSIPERYFWHFVAAGVILVAVLALLGLRLFGWYQRSRVQGLAAEIVDQSQQRVTQTIRAPKGWARTMTFVAVRPNPAYPPQLASSGAGGTRYTVRRCESGKVFVSVPDRADEELVIGRDLLALDDAPYALRIVEPQAWSTPPMPPDPIEQGFDGGRQPSGNGGPSSSLFAGTYGAHPSRSSGAHGADPTPGPASSPPLPSPKNPYQ